MIWILIECKKSFWFWIKDQYSFKNKDQNLLFNVEWILQHRNQCFININTLWKTWIIFYKIMKYFQ